MENKEALGSIFRIVGWCLCPPVMFVLLIIEILAVAYLAQSETKKEQ